MKETICAYGEDVIRLCRTLDIDGVEKAAELLLEAYRAKKKIFVAGNGGSAGTANHFSCDFSKNAVKSDTARPKVISLSANIEVVTALGNDYCYEEIFVQQLKNLMDDGDVIILISAGGNSGNVVRAAEYVRSRKGKVIGMTGFSGGKLKDLSDMSLHIPCDSYERTEDMHMIIAHMLVCCFKSLRLGEADS